MLTLGEFDPPVSPERRPAPRGRTFRKLILSFGRGGVWPTLYWAAFGYLHRHRFQLFAMEPGMADLTIVAVGARYDVWDAERMRRWRRGRRGLPVEIYQDQIDGTDACAVALVADEVAGFIWIYQQPQPSRLFHLRPDEGELNFGHVGHRYRRMGLFRSVLVVGAAWLAERGCRTVYGGVHVDNVASLRAFEHAGFRRVATIAHVGPFRPKYTAPSANGSR